MVSSASGDFSLVRSRKLAAASPPGLCLAGPGWRPQLSRPAVSDGYAKFPLRFSLSFALSFFGPSLGTPFSSGVLQTLLRPLLTAPGLSAGGSPRVRVCSFRSRLWALQSAVSDCRASRVLACSPPTPCLTAHLCSFGRTFAFHPFAPAPCRDDLAVRLRLASLPPSGTFHPDRPDPCRAHERAVHGAWMSLAPRLWLNIANSSACSRRGGLKAALPGADNSRIHCLIS